MEILVRINSRYSGNKRLDAERTHRGSMIVAKPDGWPWSIKEREHPEWVIIRVPITPVEADAFTAPETDFGRHKLYCYKRRYTLDLDALGIKESNEIIDLKHRSLVNYVTDKGCAYA